MSTTPQAVIVNASLDPGSRIRAGSIHGNYAVTLISAMLENQWLLTQKQHHEATHRSASTDAPHRMPDRRSDE
jgi:hypothetical protein